jgi:CheY-like chemotaxis protein
MIEGKTVLVADDDWDCRFLVATALRHVGFTVIEACDGLEAVEIAREHRPHAVVMDLIMPVIDGVIATILLRQDEGLKDVPVVALSAEETPRETAYLFSACLRKPISPFYLATVVSKILEKKP